MHGKRATRYPVIKTFKRSSCCWRNSWSISTIKSPKIILLSQLIKSMTSLFMLNNGLKLNMRSCSGLVIKFFKLTSLIILKFYLTHNKKLSSLQAKKDKKLTKLWLKPSKPKIVKWRVE